MEITIISAKGLKKTSSTLFSHKIKPFVTITTTLPPSPRTTISNADKNCHVYKTRVDEQGGANPTWGDKFQLPHIDASFFYLRIPAADILDETLPAGAVHRLSYRLRNRDGSRGHGVVNVAVKLQGLLDQVVQPAQRRSDRYGRQLPEMGSGYN